MKTMTVNCVRLNALHERTIAVQFAVPGRDELLVGRGMYERDQELGPVLRIEFASQGDGEIFLAENGWSGEILSGEAVGCDFFVRLD
jgi:hypothetical protein